MILGLVIIITSFFLDGLLSIYQLHNIGGILYFQTLFTITSLTLIFPYFINNKDNYYKICAIIGLLFDLVYTDTLILNACLFLALGYVINRSYNYFTNNIINGVIINTAIIILYNALSLFILDLIGYTSIQSFPIISKEISVLVINTIFFIIVYSLSNRVGKKYRIKCLN